MINKEEWLWQEKSVDGIRGPFTSRGDALLDAKLILDGDFESNEVLIGHPEYPEDQPS